MNFQKDIKQDFPIFQKHPDLVYLDSAATALKPQPVIDAVSNYYASYSANIHRGMYAISEQATKEYQESKQIIAQFIGARFAEEIIYTKNTTEALNAFVVSLSRTETLAGLSVVTTVLEHHANFVPWQQLCKQEGMRFQVLDVTKEGFIDISLLSMMIDRTTKVFAFSAVSNVTGTIQDVQQIVTTVKTINPNCFVVVDTAQAVAHCSVNVQDWGIDALAFSGHKLFGPTGIGVLWVKKELLEQLEPYQYGGGMIASVAKENTTYTDLPDRFEAGTPPVAEALGLVRACQYFNELGIESIQAHEQELTAYALERLSTIEQLTWYGSEDITRRVGVIPFILKRIHHHDVGQLLADQGICVRAGHHCAMPFHTYLGLTGTTRVSFSIYNTKEDVDLLIEGLKYVKQKFL